MSSVRPSEGERLAAATAGKAQGAQDVQATPPATSASAAIPFKPAEDHALPSGPQWGLAIVLCVAALAAALWMLRRRGNALAWKRPAGLLDVVETRALSPHVQLSVVRYQGRRLLLSTGPGGTQCLRDDALDEEAAR